MVRFLPRFRGAAPIQRAIIEGDEETGITIMYMEEGLDTGDMLAKAATPVGRKTGQDLHDELAQMGAELLVDTLDHLGELPRVKQDDALSTYAPMISKKKDIWTFRKCRNVWNERSGLLIRGRDPLDIWETR